MTETFINYIDECTEKLLQEEKKLAASDRKDEANLVKIRINVYGICKIYFETESKNKSGKELQEVYPQRLERLSEPWKISLEKAKEHEDTKKAVIEEIKLETLEDIKNHFVKLWEE